MHYFFRREQELFLKVQKLPTVKSTRNDPIQKKKKLYRFFSAANSTPDACVICANLKKYQCCEIQFVFCSRLSFLLTKLLTVICDVCNNNVIFVMHFTWKEISNCCIKTSDVCRFPHKFTIERCLGRRTEVTFRQTFASFEGFFMVRVGSAGDRCFPYQI